MLLSLFKYSLNLQSTSLVPVQIGHSKVHQNVKDFTICMDFYQREFMCMYVWGCVYERARDR